MKFQLFLDTKDETLFRKATSELGTVFYRVVDQAKSQYEVAYFSGSRLAKFHGLVSEAFANFVKAMGFKVDVIEVDEFAGTVKIIQKEEASE
jgi:hypothetical protein